MEESLLRKRMAEILSGTRVKNGLNNRIMLKEVEANNEKIRRELERRIGFGRGEYHPTDRRVGANAKAVRRIAKRIAKPNGDE